MTDKHTPDVIYIDSCPHEPSWTSEKDFSKGKTKYIRADLAAHDTLVSENAKLREALQDISKLHPERHYADAAIYIANAALALEGNNTQGEK